MYSGLTLTKMSGRILGTHQKIDRVARRQLTPLLVTKTTFPPIRRILHFEGQNGPDAIKRKSPAKDEPWHYFNPFDNHDVKLLKIIAYHYKQLVAELKAGNQERSAFEAAWLAHALVDGLTPAHHFPYEQTLLELRGGAGLETRTSIRDKWFIPGATRSERFKKNWQVWGTKGLLVTHGTFEMGIATILAPLSFGEVTLATDKLAELKRKGLAGWFRDTAREIGVLDMYGNFYKKGWTPRLAWQVRHQLGPTLVQTVSTVWLSALVDAGLVEK